MRTLKYTRMLVALCLLFAVIMANTCISDNFIGADNTKNKLSDSFFSIMGIINENLDLKESFSILRINPTFKTSQSQKTGKNMQTVIYSLNNIVSLIHSYLSLYVETIFISISFLVIIYMLRKDGKKRIIMHIKNYNKFYEVKI